MTVRSGLSLGLGTLLLCLLAAPAFATPHSGIGKPSVDKRVLLLNRHDNGLHLGHFTWSARFDLRELLRQQRERRHALLLAWLKSHRRVVSPPSSEPVPGGGTTFPPSGSGSTTGTVPMPEPGAALLFALGTSMVALYLRRPQSVKLG